MITTKSSYLKKEDVGEGGRDLIIKKFEREELTHDEKTEMKLVLYFTDPSYKPMVINKENGSRLKMVLKTDDTDVMVGKVINVYSDPFVAFGGKTVGGLRIRTPQQAANAPARARPAPPPVQDDGPPTPPIDAYADEMDTPF
jgi:hypothetical protein